VAVVNLVLLGASGLGHGDCEAIRDGFLGQPVNALTSLVFLAAGAWIVWRAVRVPAERAELLAFGIAVAANAVGSFVFHGPRPAGSQWLHDLSVLSVPLFATVHDLGLASGTAVTTRVRWFAGVVVGVGLLLAAAPGALVPLGFAAAATAGFGEALAYRAGYRPRPGDASWEQIVAWGVVLVALALGGLSFLLGRSDSPLCRPDSLFQLHAGWHVLVAAAAVAWAFAAFELRGAPPDRDQRLPSPPEEARHDS
jgi:hypothetical protein